MEESLIRITPDVEKAKSIIKMVETTVEMIESLDVTRFTSNITKEYYEVIRELMGVVLLLDGFKTFGEGAHKRLIEYVGEKYQEFDQDEVDLIDNLRITRNKIAYDGFFVKKDYIERRMNDIKVIIEKLKSIITAKLEGEGKWSS